MSFRWLERKINAYGFNWEMDFMREKFIEFLLMGNMKTTAGISMLQPSNSCWLQTKNFDFRVLMKEISSSMQLKG
jgi:hypothetical protein